MSEGGCVRCCRHCGRPIVPDDEGWRLTASQVPQERYHEDAAWVACDRAPAVLGFIGRHEPTHTGRS